ncbi:MAG: DUF4192 domain-containing protein [Intrasporangium sp.]|uniref:DUF4192 domain-containing protein n=1 Tax=Intrasporangium sp. TaxID=1925024 RepID=UPI0026483DE0|nr:DUF4192 domain-containing protein [Intrasporangium sp.]MDN5795252.1 DUF4192 domain-containing protein [Intrasporangium sp.]
MQQPTISLSGPADLLAVLPYHFGFRLSRSVVVVCLHERRLGLVVRLDVVAEPARAVTVAASLAEGLRREAPSSVMVIGYEDRVDETACLSEAIVRRLGVERLTVADRIVVRADRWTGLMCHCCRDEPVPAPHEVGAVATYVRIGRAALESRDDLATVLHPTEPAPPTLAQAIDDWVATVLDRDELFISCAETGTRGGQVTWAEACLEAWRDLLAGEFDDREVPEGQLSILLGSLRDKRLRDGIIAVLCPRRLPDGVLDPRLAVLLDQYLALVVNGVDADDDQDDDGQDVGDWDWTGLRSGDLGMLSRQAFTRSRLERLCRLAPESQAAPVLAVTAACAWFNGDGAAAGVAVERALELEPGHVLARLLESLLELGVRPPGLAA